MTENTVISVIICVYNSEKFLQHSLDSAFNQTLRNNFYEVILIDDCSRDDSAEIVKRNLGRQNYRFFSNPENKGLYFSCNKGINFAKGEYILRLDADDCLEKDALEEFYGAVSRNDTDFVYSDRLEIYEENSSIKHIDIPSFDIFKLTACGVLMKKDTVLKIGGYRNFLWEEYDLYIRYLKESSKVPYYIRRPLYNYFRHKKSMTYKKAWNITAWRQLIREWGIEELKRYGELPKEYIEAPELQYE
ncbi:MAG: glycosyltransferase family 2 protein [Candidatus Omnitrophica bacterium]|nr:glycosyltransferase family 2 protein [Candidatus Omnitrophota bacterium]MDD5591895.1 glycosyltransferase family 2 protein [Candidatus Omnitrophota bacterium]